MSALSWLDRVLIVVLSTLALLVPFGKADAAQVESPDREVERITVTYVEHTGSHKYPYRRYFETNDGAAYRYKNFRACLDAHEVAPRICRTVFVYAP